MALDRPGGCCRTGQRQMAACTWTCFDNPMPSRAWCAAGLTNPNGHLALAAAAWNCCPAEPQPLDLLPAGRASPCWKFSGSD